MSSRSNIKPLTDELERQRLIPLAQAAEITSLSARTACGGITATRSARIGPRRLAMRLGDVLDIGETQTV